jgi:hypothetical protein
MPPATPAPVASHAVGGKLAGEPNPSGQQRLEVNPAS